MNRCQQDRLYRAEAGVHAALSLPRLTVEEAQARVDEWRELPWWRERFKVRHIEVVQRSTNRDGSCGGLDPRTPRLAEVQLGIIEMAPVHLDAMYLAHEVVHPLCESRYGNGSHSPAFARHYLELVFLALGSDAYRRLYDAFERDGIDHEGWS